MLTLVLVLVLVLSTQASAQTITLRANLNGGEETPTILSTGAVGTVEVSGDATNREGAVTLKVFNVHFYSEPGRRDPRPAGYRRLV